jgi:serine/threonine protein kinase
MEAFAGYRILGTLGRGATATVYQAERDGRVCALKVLDAAATDPVLARRLVQEGRILASLDHPAIVKLIESGEVEGRPYLALEFVEGPTFARCLSRKAFTPKEAVFVLSAVARALHPAHREGVVHGDVCPGNILLKSDGTPKLADFGVARVRGGAGWAAGTTGGTPLYMSPEQAAGLHDQVDGRSDVYSLGVVLYETLTGRPPYSGRTTAEILGKVAAASPAPARSVEPAVEEALERVISRAMDKDPARRYPTAKELADALHDWAAGARDWFSMLPT